MAYQKLEDLPSDVKEKLPQYGQTLFMTAFNAAASDGMNEESAAKVAWDTIKYSYVKDAEGNWLSKGNTMADRPNIVGTETDPSDPIGNRENNTGTMRGG